jgi:Kef-type K+ transport system membrane component KefB
MILLQVQEFSLPLTNPTLKFFIILVIILFAPLLFNKLRIPNILGLIIAGAIIGPHGFNLIHRDSGIILSGTAGLLYIMFLAGIEIDLGISEKTAVKAFYWVCMVFSFRCCSELLWDSSSLNFRWRLPFCWQACLHPTR